MDKIDIITAVINVYDENADLRRKLADALHERGTIERTLQIPVESIGVIDSQMILIGQKKAYKDATRSWKTVSATRKDDGSISCTDFKKWCKEHVYSLPSFMSFNEFVEYFDDMLKVDYEIQKAEAIEDLKKAETEE